jgi:sortase A
VAVSTSTPPRRRAVRALSTVLIVAGLLILADGATTLLWQEPLTALQAHMRQSRLKGDLRRLQAAGPTRVERRALAHLGDERRRLAFLARSLRRTAPDGSAIARIRIPRIGADFVVVKGTSAADLRKGPGAYDDAPLPGAPGTAAVAGHRTTYLAPFRHIDALRPGDRIVMEMPYGTFTYRVQHSRIVSPDALWILRRTGYDRLVLSACHPLFSATHRIVVFARLATAVPRGAAVTGQGVQNSRADLTPAAA